jgi:hypothetical protein
MREPHPADAKGTCDRCGAKYYLCEGCDCSELTDEELEAWLWDKEQAEVEDYYFDTIYERRRF